MTHRMIPTALDGIAKDHGVLSLACPPPSLNNAFINSTKGRFKSSAYKAWQTVSTLDLRRQAGWHVPGKIAVTIHYSRADTKADLDNLIKPILDLLVANGRISDDCNVEDIHALFDNELLGVRIEISRASQEVRAA